MIMISEQVDHRLLNWTRDKHPRVLANQEQIRHHPSITRDEACAVARQVGALGERVHGEQPVVSTTVDRCSTEIGSASQPNSP